jgi:hypothetical protein
MIHDPACRASAQHNVKVDFFASKILLVVAIYGLRVHWFEGK